MSGNNKINFNIPTDTDFYIEFLSVNKTKEKPDYVFKCPANLRRWDRFFYVADGNITFESSAGTHKAKTGDILYIPYDTAYVSRWADKKHVDYITVEFILNYKSGERVQLCDSICNIITDRSGIYLDMFKKMYETWEKGEIGYKIKSRAQLYELLYFIAFDSMKNELKREHKNIYKAIVYLENNYITDVNVSQLASMCGVCESYFRRCFFDYAGMSPVKYKNKLRANKAAQLLQTGEYTVAEAAEMVGVNDIAYFNRIFKQALGKNPSEYKNRAEE
ncbi:MAG: helix-turn-helix transcriptional regulator [Clostridia bacterium]|nr:helix-turn-helix transcriptional regulator [Clostridia bacterium]